MRYMFAVGLVAVTVASTIPDRVDAATFTPVDLSEVANFNLQARKNSLYPTGTFQTRFAVPFEIVDSPNNLVNNAWGSGDGRLGGGGNDGVWTATLPVSASNVSTIYTLAGTDWGRNGLKDFSVTAEYDDGTELIWFYEDGKQLRDWNLFFASSVNGTDTREVYRVSPPLPVKDGNPDVLDMQALNVPATYRPKTLEALVFSDTRQTLVHSAFVAAVTLSDLGSVTGAALDPVPLPAAAPLLATAVGGLALYARRRRKAA